MSSIFPEATTKLTMMKPEGQYNPKPGDQIPDALMCVGYQYTQEGGVEKTRNQRIQEKIASGMKVGRCL
jgi:hypothetical protein